MAKSSTPIPQDKIGESFVWRDWFQRLSDKVFGSISSQDANNVVITGGSIDGTTIGATTPSTGKFTDLYAATLAVDTGTDGQVLIGRTSDHHFVPALLTAGTNVSISTGPSSVTITASSFPGFAGLDGIDGEEGQSIPGPRGLTGSQGPQGAATYLEADYQEAEMFLIPGSQGVTGNTGPQGATGFDGDQGEEGPRGPQGLTGAQGPAGPVVYLEAPEADEPMFTGGPTVPVNGSLTWSVPVTKTADFTLGVFETYVINNKAAATCTVTLPSASGYPGRPVSFINYKAFTLVSASSNVVPIAGGSAGTAILAASVGDTTTLISDGTNWIQVKYEPNNCLLLE
ncbi:Collagen triple helix repeat [uncultured Caudovirales phage]|uniref:Collagen triple helix repeat n=1 Tax=uncultured Caudovirales phage TaxID=2100421 RepID=A0A6J5PCW7_9CAUD|nr:Collagen triple helix repeat [uncultured Caudovirales phage]